jgi:uncharacterized membrane protein SpoIIM required for sporulation
MRQDAFERAGSERWRRFELALAELDARRAVSDFPRQYRLVCQDLVLARDRQFEASLVARLNALALRGHQHLHGARTASGGFSDLFLRRFPRSVRAEWRLFALMCVLLYGVGGGVFALVQREPDFVYSIVAPEHVAEMEAMYDPGAASRSSEGKATDGILMVLYYVGNNVSVAFRTFASGIAFGVGSVLMITYNALSIGAIAGHLASIGYGQTFFPFVIGHGSFELTAIALAGVAGLRMGLALVVTGRHSRAHELREATQRAVPILYGMTGMLLLAAVIEGLWSGQRAIPPLVRYWVGAGLWLTVIAWLSLGGRRGAAP